MSNDNPAATRAAIQEMGKKGDLNQAPELIANNYTAINSVPSHFFRAG